MSGGAPGLRDSVKAMPREAWVLFAGAFVNRFGTFVLPFLVLYMRSRGYSAAQAGLAASAYGAGAFAAAGIGGWFADRVGRRAAIATSMFSVSAAMMGLSQAESLPALLSLSALAGLTGELYRPATGALLADIIPPERRVSAFAIYRLFINAGFAAGPAVAGLLANKSFFLLFAGDAITSALFGVIALIALPEGVRSNRKAEQRGETLRAVRSDRTFALFLLASFMTAFVYMQQQSVLPLHVSDAGLSTAAFGFLISLNGIVVVLLELPIAAYTQRRDPRTILVFSSLLLGFGFAMTGLFDAVPLLSATVVIWTLGEISGAPVSSAYLVGLAPPHLRGRYQGLMGMMYSIALFLAPVAGTAVYAQSPAAVWALCGALGAASALCLAVPPRRLRRELPAA